VAIPGVDAAQLGSRTRCSFSHRFSAVDHQDIAISADKPGRWQRFGALNGKRDNLILYPSSYSRASRRYVSWLIGPQGILDPTRWCIIAVRSRKASNWCSS
jgi:hypothetical protein